MSDQWDDLLWDDEMWANFLNNPQVPSGCGNENSGKTSPENETVAVGGDIDKGKGKETMEDGKGGGSPSNYESAHIRAERKRRERLQTMFSNLHALLPQQSDKVKFLSFTSNLMVNLLLTCMQNY